MSTNAPITTAEPFECPICQCQVGTPGFYVDVETEVVTTTCGHQFGNLCLERWLESANTCPMCRAVLVDLVPAEATLGQVQEEPFTEIEVDYLVDQLLELQCWVVSAYLHHVGLSDGAPNIFDYDQHLSWVIDFYAFLQTRQGPENDALRLLRTAVEAVAQRQIDYTRDNGDAKDVDLLDILIRHMRPGMGEQPENNPENMTFHEDIFQLQMLVTSYADTVMNHIFHRMPTEGQTLHRMAIIVHCALFAIEAAESDPEVSAWREFLSHLAVHGFSAEVANMDWSNLMLYLVDGPQALNG